MVGSTLQSLDDGMCLLCSSGSIQVIFVPSCAIFLVKEHTGLGQHTISSKHSMLRYPQGTLLFWEL